MKKDLEYNYINEEIKDSLIRECEEKFEETGVTHFIFDKDTTNKIDSFSKTKEEIRNDKISEIIDKDSYGFYISDTFEFKSMPSRYAYYDTETKLVGKYKRYEYVINYIKNIGFKPSKWNLGMDYEQSFTMDHHDNKWTIRLSKNLFMKVNIFDGSKEDLRELYSGYFSKSSLLKCFESDITLYRELKIKSLL